MLVMESLNLVFGPFRKFEFALFRTQEILVKALKLKITLKTLCASLEDKQAFSSRLMHDQNSIIRILKISETY